MGAETRIAVAEDIVLDFAGLFSPIEGEKQAPESPTEPLLRAVEYKTIEMTSKIRELKELKAMAEDLAAEITAIEDTIKAEMTARNTDEMTVDVYKIRWTKVLSNRFDSSAFKKAMPELHAQFTKQTESRRFTIA